MKKLARSLSLVLVFGLSVLAEPTDEVFPQNMPEQTTGAAQDPAIETPEIWFVEMTASPAADGGNRTTARGQHARFRAAARAAGIPFNERYAYDTLFNGVSIAVDPTRLAAVARLPGVKAIYPVVPFTLPEPIDPGSQPELATALAMTGADIAGSELGLTGAGIKVGVIDSGIDYDHPDLGGCFGDGCRVAIGRDFVGDAFTGTNTPVPDADPDDCSIPLASPPAPSQTAGHGTHVSGIIGANGTITGVAPGVTFGAYRVFGCNGSTLSDIMLAAMEQALADGMDIVNMSIGTALQWPQYPTAAASSRLVNQGVTVVAAAGNEGTLGLYGSAAPALGEKVISVASFNNTHSNTPYFTLSPDDRVVTYLNGIGAPHPPLSGTFPIERTGTATSTNDACNAVLPLPDLTGRVALIRRGICAFTEKVANAQNAGAVAVIIYNNVAGGILPTLLPPVSIPVVGISAADGEAINARIAGGGVTLTWQAGYITTPIANGVGVIAASSSWGPAPDLSLKPDIGAPGGTIRSTYPLELGGYATLGGTSMASPHVAGAVALLLEARPNTPSQAVGRILQNSAVPRVWNGNPGLGFLDNVHRQGAGLLRIDRAILATTAIQPGKLSLGEIEAGSVTQTLTITNEGPGDVTYQLSHVPALATGPNTFTLSFFNAPASVALSTPSILVPAGGSGTVDVTITPHPGLAPRSLFGGYILFTPAGGGAASRVPYTGFKGDYQSIPVLTTPTGAPGNPLLRRTLSFGPNEHVTIRTALKEVAWVLLHLDHSVRRLRLDVFDAVTGKSWHRALDFDYVGRSAAATSYFALPWDGVTVQGSGNGATLIDVPSGQYELRLSVLKALGDETNPAHWEQWTSPTFVTIVR